MEMQPVNIKKYHIYDIYHNDNNELIIIQPFSHKLLDIKYVGLSNIKFKIEICPHWHTCIYISKKSIEYKQTIKLNINGQLIETCVNKYPEFNGEIIMSTLVKGEDEYIKQWILFYLNLGIDRFIIYDNSRSNTLQKVLQKYIDKKKVVLIRWSFPYQLFSFPDAQTTQQNHSIYAFKNSKYIGLFDVDEYINIQNDKNIKTFLKELIIDEKVNANSIGSFKLLSKPFFNPYNQPENDFEFLKIYYCGQIIKKGYEKNFVLPKNVSTFSVHMITKGKPMYTVSSEKIYINHYLFLNKKKSRKIWWIRVLFPVVKYFHLGLQSCKNWIRFLFPVINYFWNKNKLYKIPSPYYHEILKLGRGKDRDRTMLLDKTILKHISNL